MKVYITKTSDWKFAEVREYGSLEECVDKLLAEEDFFNNREELVISKTGDFPEAASHCDYEVEIYDTWRE